MTMKISKVARNEINELGTRLGEKFKMVEDAIADYNVVREELHTKLESTKDELQGEFDGMSERWQGGERGEAAKAWIESIGEQADKLEDEMEIETIDAEEVVGFPDQPE